METPPLLRLETQSVCIAQQTRESKTFAYNLTSLRAREREREKKKRAIDVNNSTRACMWLSRGKCRYRHKEGEREREDLPVWSACPWTWGSRCRQCPSRCRRAARTWASRTTRSATPADRASHRSCSLAVVSPRPSRNSPASCNIQQSHSLSIIRALLCRYILRVL